MQMLKRILVLTALIAAFSTHAIASGATGNWGKENYYDMFLRNIPELLSQNSDLFVDMGLNLFRGVATIMVAWYGVELITGGTTGPRLVPLLWRIALVGTILTFYVEPIPGIGRGFRQLFTDQAHDMSKIISNSHVQTAITHLHGIQQAEGIAPSNPFDVSGSIRYWMFIGVIAVALAVSICVVAYGFLGAAVAGLLGPFFIPFFLVPGMEWMAWGWLKSFIQYAFYPVIANAYTFVLMQAVLKVSVSSGRDIALNIMPLMVILIAYIYCMVKLPSLVNSLFSGRSGESGFWKP
jgi:hypothetical protein